MRTFGIVSLAVILAAAGFVACSRSGSPDPARVETIGGVELVHNPATPLHPARSVRLVEELAIAPTDAAGKILLSRPGSYAVAADGRIAIGDDQDQVIQLFAADGRHLRALGRKGQGPGEFGSVGSMIFLADGSLAALDWGNQKTVTFGPNLELRGEAKWLSRRVEIFFQSADGLVMSEYQFSGQDRKLPVKAFGADGAERRTFGEFSEPEFKPLRTGHMTIAISTPYSVQSILAGDRANRRLYHCRNDRYRVEVYDESGRLFREIDRPYERPPFTAEDADEYRHGFDRNRNRSFAELAAKVELPKVKTVTERMVVDGRGFLWVSTFEKRAEGGRDLAPWDVFDADGRYDARVWLDAGLRGVGFAADRLYAFVVDEETGERTLERFKLEWRD